MHLPKIIFGVFESDCECCSLLNVFYDRNDAIKFADERGLIEQDQGKERIKDPDTKLMQLEDTYTWNRIGDGNWETKDSMYSIDVDEIEIK